MSEGYMLHGNHIVSVILGRASSLPDKTIAFKTTVQLESGHALAG